MAAVTRLSALVAEALQEDAADSDLTCKATIAEDQIGEAIISAKASGVLSGVIAAKTVFEQVDAGIRQEWSFADSDAVDSGDVICRLSGRVSSLLAAERTALNFLQHLSGVATLTHTYVQAVRDTGCQIADTRKTTPGMRHLEKKAVVHGGGINHRMDLKSGMLIKENHIAAAGSIAKAILACRSLSANVWVEVECETIGQVCEAVECRPDIILLDNMNVDTILRARAMVPKHILLEASGGIDIANAHAYAKTGVDRLAIGAITHSAPALDLSMRLT